MATLPIALPMCGEPATTRIEVYGGDSLDAAAYTCDPHVSGALATVAEAGMLGRTAPGPLRVSRPCGYVHAYPTGQLAQPDDIRHPQWCDRRNCVQRQQHRSLRLPVNTGRPEAAIIDVSLVQALSDVVDPMMALNVVDGDHSSELVLSTGQGRVLSYQVRRLLDMSKGHPGGRRPAW